MENTIPQPSRTPKNLLEFVSNPYLNNDWMTLLAKHHKGIKSILAAKAVPEEIKSALFIIELNNFKGDLIKIVSLCEQIQSTINKHCIKRARNRESLRSFNSKELMDRAGSFFRSARYYDKNFEARKWLPKLDGRPFSFKQMLFPNPFHHDPSLSNEENLNIAVINIILHDEYFKNFLNTFYGDGKDGEIFLGKSFSDVASEYRWIKSVRDEIANYLPQQETNVPVKKIETYENSLSIIMEKHPATLHLAITEMIKYLEKPREDVS